MKKRYLFCLMATILCLLFVGCHAAETSAPKSPLDEYSHLVGRYMHYSSYGDYALDVNLELLDNEVHPVVSYSGYMGKMNDDATIVKLGEDGYLIRVTGSWLTNTHHFMIELNPNGTSAEISWGDSSYTCYREEN